MRKIKYEYLLFVCVTVGLIFALIIPNGSSVNAQGKYSIPSSRRELPTSEGKVLAPIQEKTGEEIPDWIARWELAKVLSYLKRYDESIIEYKKLIKEKPDLSEAKIEMANVLVWQGKQNEALENWSGYL